MDKLTPNIKFDFINSEKELKNNFNFQNIKKKQSIKIEIKELKRKKDSSINLF